jgi:uncharacterized protein
MIIVDTNLLVYAYNSDSPKHQEAMAWFEDLLNSDEVVGLAEIVLIGFIRIVTQKRIVPKPLSPQAAVTLVRSWLALTNVRLLLSTPESFALTLEAICLVGVAGNLCTDAQIAGIAQLYRGTIASVDTDFLRFAGLKIFNPLG